MQKISSFHHLILKIKSTLESCDRLATPISDHAHPKTVWSTFNFYELVSNVKNQAISLIILEIRLIKKSCNLIGREHFGPDLMNKNFPKYGIYAGTQQIIWILIIDQIQFKLMTIFSNKLKKPCFWSIFPIFRAKKLIFNNSKSKEGQDNY